METIYDLDESHHMKHWDFILFANLVCNDLFLAKSLVNVIKVYMHNRLV